MKLLGIETSSNIFSVAVCEGEKVLQGREAGEADRPSALLAELIQEALQKSNLTLSALDGFAISIGPGSFTGLRVGVMTVKTLSWALKKPVLPVSSLEVIAQNAKGEIHPVVPFMDARKGKVYMASFLPDGKGLPKRLAPDQLLLPEEAFAKMPTGALLVGDGLKRYGDLLEPLKESGIRFAPAESWIPRAREVCRVACLRWPEGKMDDPHQLVPRYLYSKESDITGW